MGKGSGTAVLALAWLQAATSASATVIQPPPRPPGWEMVRVQPGVSPPEQDRAVRAHSNKMHGHVELRQQAHPPVGGHAKGFFYGEPPKAFVPRK